MSQRGRDGADGGSKTWLLVAAGLLVVPVVAVLAFTGGDEKPADVAATPSEPSRERPSEAPAAAASEVPAAPSAAPPAAGEEAEGHDDADGPRPSGADLFSGPAPELIAKAYEVTQAGNPISAKKLKEIFAYGQSNPDDARPQMIFAMDDMNRQWFNAAVDHYRAAYDADPSAREYPRMLPDLIQLSTRASQHRAAKTAIAEIYGPEARGALEAAIAEAKGRNDAVRALFLQKVLDEL